MSCGLTDHPDSERERLKQQRTNRDSDKSSSPGVSLFSTLMNGLYIILFQELCHLGDKIRGHFLFKIAQMQRFKHDYYKKKHKKDDAD